MSDLNYPLVASPTSGSHDHKDSGSSSKDTVMGSGSNNSALSVYAGCLRLLARRLTLCLRVLLDLTSEAVFVRVVRRGAAAKPAIPFPRYPILMLSATELAERIRKREVRIGGKVGSVQFSLYHPFLSLCPDYFRGSDLGVQAANQATPAHP